MLRLKSWGFWLSMLSLFMLTVTVSAQNPTLTARQPVSVDVDGIIELDYTIAQTSQVSLQAISATVQTSLTVLRNGEAIANQPNPTGALTVTLDVLIPAGTYQVRVESLNRTAGAVILLVQSETPVAMTDIGLDTFVSETLDAEKPLALYRLSNLPEEAYLYIDSELPQGGLSAVVSLENGAVIGSLGTGATGIRLTLPLSSVTYVVQLTPADRIAQVPFTLCLTAVSVRGCEFGGGAVINPVATSVGAPSLVACTVTPSNSGGANIRQSASTGSIVVGALPGNQSADVLGKSPDNAFFNIQYGNLNGWVAQSVVVTAGVCDTLATVQPPAIIAPTNTPTPTPIPPTSTPEGPCLLFINSPTNVYVTTVADSSNLFDQIASGTVEAIGRNANNTWWQTNYGNSWIQTNTFGNTVSTGGACHNLPVVMQ